MNEATRRPYLPTLDGLRAIAVLLVLWSHVPPALPDYPQWLFAARVLVEPGYFGVDLFFVLSGFLITRILLVERRRHRPVRWFMLRRLLRIFPPYYLLLAIVALVHPGPEIPWALAYLGNVYFAFHDVPSPVQHTWSLCVEEHFYLLWPWFVAWVPLRLQRRLLGVMLPAIWFAAFASVSLFAPRHVTALAWLSPFRFSSIGLGCVLAYVESLRAAEGPAPVPGPFASATWQRGRTTALALALLAIAFAISELHVFLLVPTGYAPFSPEISPWLPPVYAPAFKLVSFSLASTGCLLLAANARTDRPVGWLLASAPLRAIGRISYGVYLYHLPIFRLVLHPAPSQARAVLALGLTLVAATVSYLAFERPLLRFGARFR